MSKLKGDALQKTSDAIFEDERKMNDLVFTSIVILFFGFAITLALLAFNMIRVAALFMFFIICFTHFRILSKGQSSIRKSTTQKKERSKLFKSALIILIPPLFMVSAKFLFDPNWLYNWSYLQMIIAGGIMSIFAGVVGEFLLTANSERL